jgi:hypothetical protein
MLTYMPDETETLLRRLISDDQAAVAAVLAGARTSDTPALLVAAALISGDSDGLLLARATTHATTTRDRQLVAVAAADLEGDHDLFDALIRDHLADHPDNVLAAPGSPPDIPSVTSSSLAQSRHAHLETTHQAPARSSRQRAAARWITFAWASRSLDLPPCRSSLRRHRHHRTGYAA